MSVSLPNGVIISLGTVGGSPVAITAISNANPAVVTSSSHGYSDGDIVVVTSGWAELNDRVVKLNQTSSSEYEMLGINATDTDRYPAGTGVGTTAEVTAWTQITQITGLTSSGGDMQFVTYSFLESSWETQLPTQAAPMSIQMEIADDPSLAGYIALQAAAEARTPTPLKLAMPSGAVVYMNGYCSFNEVPSMNKNQLSTVRATFSLLSKPVRYAP